MTLLRFPTFASHLRVEDFPPDGLLLLAEDGAVHLKGELFRGLAPLIDGTRSVEQIVASASKTYGAAEVYYGLGFLEQQGFLVEATPESPRAAAAFWHSLGTDPRRAAERISQASVSLVAFGEVPLEPVREALAQEGIPVSPGGSIAIAVVDDYLQAPLEAMNREALRTGQPWLLLRPLGKELWLGPRFVPGQSACWECLAQRLRLNRPLDVFLGERRPGTVPMRPARAGLESTLGAAAHLLASAVARQLATGDDGLVDTLVTLDFIGLGTRRHLVTRRPQCPACGDPGLMAMRQERPITLESRPKVFTQDGGHRIHGPHETLRRHERHVSPLTGVVQLLEPIGDPEGIAPVYDSGQNRARLGEGATLLLHALRRRSAGKGKTAAQARASALAEAIERASTAWHGDEARRLATLEELGNEAVSPEHCLLFSERQYQEREALNARGLARPIPHRFDPTRRISWTPMWSLTYGTRRYLPTALCFHGFQDEGVPPFSSSDSNGCAAGNTLEEAILQGFLELVERDALAIWWYNRLHRPGVALEGFDEPYLRELERHYRGRGRELWVLDVTNDLGIPVFAAVSRRVDGGPELPLLGFGAHLDARVALLRAVTELNQALAAEPRPGQKPGESGGPEWLTHATLAEHPYLAPDPSQPARTATDYPLLSSTDLREDVERCVRIVREQGLEMLVLDLTRPDVGLSVARVVVPGLRHFWRRLGPGRLYEVPIRQGWLAHPVEEEMLNPHELAF